MAKSAVYGITSVSLAEPVVGGFPTTWAGFTFKAIVKDSLSFNDSAPSSTDIDVEEVDETYETLKTDNGSKGFTMDTYDISEESYTALLGFTKDATTKYNIEPAKSSNLIKAVQIITRDLDDIVSKTFEWAKMNITVTKAGSIGKSGFPNLHLEFKQLANLDASGVVQSGHRWKNTADTATA